MPTRRRILILLAALATTLGLAVPAATAGGGADDVATVAHRGSSAMAPENTLASVRLAVRQGADYIENDIMRTKDGALVVMHDLTLTRTTNVEEVFPDRAPWNTADFTLAEIKQLDAGSWFAPQFAGQRVPTLREWVEAVGPRTGMLLEAKDPWAFPGIEVDIDRELNSIKAFRKALADDRVIMQAGDVPFLEAYAAIAHEVPIARLYYTRPTDAELVADSEWLDGVNPALGNIDEAIVDRIHELGMFTHVWTVNLGRDMYRGIAWGVDGIITDYPTVLEDIKAAA